MTDISPTRKYIKQRLTIVYWFMLAFGVAIVIKMFVLQFVQKEHWLNQLKETQLREIVVPAQRGDICARDGKVMVSSVPYFMIHMDTRSNGLKDTTWDNNVEKLAESLARLFNDSTAKDYKTKEQYLKELKNARAKNSRYHLIKKKVSYTEYKQIKTFPILKYGRFRGGFLDSLYMVRNRYYNDLAARTIGRAENLKDGYYKIGIEGAYDHYLSGSDGLKIPNPDVIVGRSTVFSEDYFERPPVDGYDLITTIDVNIQDAAQSALMKQLLKNNADKGVAIVMEVNTGDIVAMVNLSKNKEGTQIGEYYNMAIGYSTEPGSTFKLASVMAALEDGYLQVDEMVNTEDGKLRLGPFTIRDSNNKGYGTITAKQAFEKSSNVGIAKLIRKYYATQPDKFVDRLYRFNLNNPTGIDLVGEGTPKIKTPKNKSWNKKISLPQMSIGYEVSLTPLQTLTFFNAVANNGVMVKPRFVKAVVEDGRVIKDIKTEVISAAICSKKTLAIVKSMLEGVVERGTATNLKTQYFSIAGKTGTAQIYDETLKSYTSHYKGSFAGYFPADNPKFSCYVMIYRPREHGYYGGAVAGPVVKEIAEKLYSTYPDFQYDMKEFKQRSQIANVKRLPEVTAGSRTKLNSIVRNLKIPVDSANAKGKMVSIENNSKKIIYRNYKLPKKAVPSVIGMTAREAMTILENLGITVVLNGKGRVVKQSIPPGKSLNNNQTINLELRQI